VARAAGYRSRARRIKDHPISGNDVAAMATRMSSHGHAAPIRALSWADPVTYGIRALRDGAFFGFGAAIWSAG
jgi:hypothetical protein